MADETAKPKKRGWLQFSITALLVVTTICAILFAWWRDRTQLLRRLEVETLRAQEMAERAAMERDRALLSRDMARATEEAARASVDHYRAALLEVLEQSKKQPPESEERVAPMNAWVIRMSRCILLLVVAFPACAAAEDENPNIILLMGDDHGWDETAYNGHPHLKTPVLDEMAAQGLRFDRFYSASPVCSPTRGSVLTGRHPNRYGTFAPNWSIRPEEISIAQILNAAGYACGHFGKWHVGPVKADSPTNPGAMGFDEWLSHDNFFEMHPTLSPGTGITKALNANRQTIAGGRN